MNQVSIIYKGEEFIVDDRQIIEVADACEDYITLGELIGGSNPRLARLAKAYSAAILMLKRLNPKEKRFFGIKATPLNVREWIQGDDWSNMFVAQQCLTGIIGGIFLDDGDKNEDTEAKPEKKTQKKTSARKKE